MEDCVSVVLVFLTAEKIGLIFNFIGTLMVAASFGKNLGEGYQIDSSGNKVYLASFLYPRLFFMGLVLLGLGFLLQLFW